MAKIRYKDRIKILHVTSELTPIAKAGGLGDVVGQLPKEMAKEFHLEIKVILPLYKTIDLKAWDIEPIMRDLKIKGLGKKEEKISVYKTYIPDTMVTVYLVEMPKVFSGDDVYGHKINKTYKVSAFFVFSKIVLELLKALDWHPDVIHCHDGMMGMLPKWLNTIYSNHPFYKDIATVLTIHNLSYQQIVTNNEFKYLDLKRTDFAKIKKFFKVTKGANIMAEAIDNADMVNTVSPTYSREVMTKKYGAGLHKLLKIHKKKFTGILNGIDYFFFDPRVNEDTPVKYWIDNLDKKVENKIFLQKKLKLTVSADLPLICVISRLAPQKGLDLIGEVLDELVDMGAQFVILGAGQEKIEKIFVKAEKEYPKDIAAEMEFNANFAQTIYAGADMILMPSRFEPCGLSQIIAMRFGTIPIVRKTGGLADTVKDGYTGFVFKHYDKNAFLWVIRRAVDMYYNQKDHWRKMQIQAMKKDFSWKASAKKYIWLYKKAISNHRKKLEASD